MPTFFRPTTLYTAESNYTLYEANGAAMRRKSMKYETSDETVNPVVRWVNLPLALSTEKTNEP